MAPRKRTRRRRSNRQVRLSYLEQFTFSTTFGATSTITRATLTSLPQRTNFRPIWFEVEACTFVPPTSTSSTFGSAPCAMQLQFLEGGTPSIAVTVNVSRCVPCGPIPRRLRLHYPRSADWRSYDALQTEQLCSINAVCIGSTGGGSGYLRGIGRILFALQQEEVVPTCPTNHLEDDSDHEGYVTC